MTRAGSSAGAARGRLAASGRDALLLGARLLVAQLFLLGAAQKGTSPGEVEALLAGRGWPEALVWPALAFNLAAGLALVLGWRLREAGLLLAAYCLVTSIFHWIPSDPWQMTIVVKNWAVAGGCLALAAAGPGRWAVRAAPAPSRPPPRP